MIQKDRRKLHAKGFTLIELVLTLVILSFIGLGASAFLVYGVEGFLLARANNEVFQKANLAMERLVRETKNFDQISQISAGSMLYQRNGITFGVALVNGNIRMIRGGAAIPSANNPGSVLIDNINAFTLNFWDVNGAGWAIPADNSLTGLARITISMTVNVSNTIRVFTVDINPLYNNMVNGPTS
ncbi:MAG: prepilin-type N-terminal cleavage/methylation domain-containing protein [Proteobacteria bacterium]|nr:prepilin-type N-terminal cleavage/methylation domain-containing protein [Pseudomonadota bacterium]MBU1583759.1 prepilin-type N-terminal cleavage/methylation domain-containing protein [Pseudomonadota bacterium]MBU2630234.1 prepilin-type N-terminal cleavage/methylation domain-containing protein [Pseudomonadota bacterium]